MKVLIIGNRGGTNIGGCLERAAVELRLDVRLVEARLAIDAPVWLRRFNWWFRGKRPTWLDRFSRDVLELCGEWNPHTLIATGIAPLNEHAVREIAVFGIHTVNYLTDDPWNSAHRASWFFDALPHYDVVFSPRHSNLEDLIEMGCPEVQYLPFAYAPELHYPEPPASPEEKAHFSSDVVFVGSGDRDRVPFIFALVQHRFRVGLYGSFWERFQETRSLSRGQADVRTLRKATSGAKVALCLVRRANRDGHVMRSFEIPAIGACMLTEDTEEHRKTFGKEGKAVVYFRTVDEMVEKLRWLLDHDDERRRLAAAAYTCIVNGRNTYKDRLITMLELARSNVSTF